MINQSLFFHEEGLYLSAAYHCLEIKKMPSGFHIVSHNFNTLGIKVLWIETIDVTMMHSIQYPLCTSCLSHLSLCVCISVLFIVCATSVIHRTKVVCERHRIRVEIDQQPMTWFCLSHSGSGSGRIIRKWVSSQTRGLTSSDEAIRGWVEGAQICLGGGR